MISRPLHRSLTPLILSGAMMFGAVGFASAQNMTGTDTGSAVNGGSSINEGTTSAVTPPGAMSTGGPQSTPGGVGGTRPMIQGSENGTDPSMSMNSPQEGANMSENGAGTLTDPTTNGMDNSANVSNMETANNAAANIAEENNAANTAPVTTAPVTTTNVDTTATATPTDNMPLILGGIGVLLVLGILAWLFTRPKKGQVIASNPDSK